MIVSERLRQQDSRITAVENKLRVVTDADAKFGQIATELSKLNRKVDAVGETLTNHQGFLSTWATNVAGYRTETNARIDSLIRNIGGTVAPSYPPLNAVPSIQVQGQWDAENSAVWDLPPAARKKYEANKRGRNVATIAAVAAAVVAIAQTLGPILQQLLVKK